MFLKASETGMTGGTKACLEVAVEKPVLASGGGSPAGVADALAVTENMAGRLFSSSLYPAETRRHLYNSQIWMSVESTSLNTMSILMPINVECFEACQNPQRPGKGVTDLEKFLAVAIHGSFCQHQKFRFHIGGLPV